MFETSLVSLLASAHLDTRATPHRAAHLDTRATPHRASFRVEKLVLRLQRRLLAVCCVDALNTGAVNGPDVYQQRVAAHNAFFVSVAFFWFDWTLSWWVWKASSVHISPIPRGANGSLVARARDNLAHWKASSRVAGLDGTNSHAATDCSLPSVQRGGAEDYRGPTQDSSLQRHDERPQRVVRFTRQVERQS